MSEALAWKLLNAELRDRWQAVRLNDRLTQGLPDVLWTADGATGLWELKSVPRWGVGWRWTTAAQPVWLWQWCRAGGRAHAVVYERAERTWGLVVPWPEESKWPSRALRAPWECVVGRVGSPRELLDLSLAES